MMTLCLSILASACQLPLPEGVPMSNADPAMRALLSFWGEDEIRLPVVMGVPADPECAKPAPGGGTAIGFVNPQSGLCVGGMAALEHGTLFLVMHPDVTYAGTLPHELQHWIRGDGEHKAPGVWEDAADNLVPTAAAFLRMFPEVDTMRVAGEGRSHGQESM